MMPKYVYRFDEGGREQRDLLGGKGANLAEMTRLGLPVPPGFTITTEACRATMRDGRVPPALRVEVTTALREVEDALGRRLGAPQDPLLVSVRSGAKFSMPGMMDTVLNVGLTDASVPGLAAASGDERFAWDSYRRLVQMFGATVLGVAAEAFDAALEARKAAAGATADVDLSAADLRSLVDDYRAIVRAATVRDFPQDPREQLDLAIEAVLGSWNTERARLYRRRERIPDDLGTAVNVVAMVFGNLGDDSGTGVAFTRDPSTGRPGVYGDYLPNAQGEDVVAGTRNTLTLEDLRERDPRSHGELLAAMRRLETHYRDLCDIEFTIERGRLWLLQTRVGKRTAAAAFRIAVQLVDEHLLTTDEALARVTGEQLGRLLFPRFDAAAATPLLRGLGASPGAAVGEIVLDNAQALERTQAGADVVLVRRETSPDDLAGMIAAVGVLTARGGKTSHAAVVARGMGRCAVVGAEALDVDHERGEVRVDGTVLRPGDVIALDGTTGEVFRGEVPVVDSPVLRYVADGLEAGLAAAPDDDAAELVRAVHRLLTHADTVRHLGVRANADTAEDALRARRRGAEGIGLCRTEHQFLGERRVHVERVVLAADDDERRSALAALLPLQRDDFTALLEAMDGLPTTIRLLDPPLHEFLPDLTELSVRVALAAERGEAPGHEERLLAAVRRMHEQNPMLGLRGVRLGLTVPGLFALQVRAVAEAAAALHRAGRDPRPEIMVPLVGSVREMQLVREEARAVLAQVADETGVTLEVPVGCMVELPRAALTAQRIATQADFFSFGTNDLTQTTWGFSRDDVEGAFFSEYLENGVLTISPFETIDADGVGALVRTGVERGRSARPGLPCGMCGEHGGDPESIRFFHDVGLDYVSCSPFRVPVARLEAGRAAVVPAEDAGA